MRRKNDNRRERLIDQLERFVDKLDEGFTGLVRIEVPVLRGILGQHTFTVSQRDTD